MTEYLQFYIPKGMRGFVWRKFTFCFNSVISMVHHIRTATPSEDRREQNATAGICNSIAIFGFVPIVRILAKPILYS